MLSVHPGTSGKGIIEKNNHIIVGQKILYKTALEMGMGTATVFMRRDGEEEVAVSYDGVPKDGSGWVDAGMFYPVPYDLCMILTRGGKKAIKGWWTGNGWFGRSLRPEEVVIKWQRARDYV